MKSLILFRLIFATAVFLFLRTSSILAEDERSVTERARAAQTMKLHLMAADLLDELVYQWSSHPPTMESKARVSLIRLSVPVGINSELTAFLENHLYNLLLKNPQIGLIAVYCGLCLEFTAYGTSKATVISRGADIPELAHSIKEQADFGLYLDMEAVGSSLVLRAYLTDFSTNRIVAVKTLVTNTSHPPLLRQATHLHSSEDARQEYVQLLQGRPKWSLALGMRTSILLSGAADVQVPPVPFFWGMAGLETTSDSAKKWLMDLQLGAASLADQYNATLLSGRFYRLLASDTVDLVAPNVYLFFGLGYWDVKGNGALIFKNKSGLTAGEVAATTEQRQYKPHEHCPSVSLGIDTRLGNLLRLDLFLERFLNQDNNRNLNSNIHAYGFDLGVVL